MMAWRAGLRARSFPASRFSQRPTILPSRRAKPGPGAVRYASDAAPAETAKEIPRRAARGSRKGLYGTSLALVLLVGYIYGTDTRASIHRYAVVPLLRLLYPDAEDAHHSGVDNLKVLYRLGLHPRERGDPDRDGALATEVYETL